MAGHLEVLRLARLADELGLGAGAFPEGVGALDGLVRTRGQGDPTLQLRRFAFEVAPAVREAVGRARTK